VDECHYAGELPYWDWTLDWQAFPSAPVWDLDHGFSGDGTASSESSTLFSRSHCLSEGRFKNFEVVYAGSTLSPHCLTRDIGSGEPLDELMQNIRPDALKTLMHEDDYYRFLIHLEARPHISIPKAIMGDFSLFTAPNGERWITAD
jgi:tyrosinase